MKSPLAIIEEVHEMVDMPDDCGACPHLIAMDDGYGTGDSPTMYECGASSRCCPEVKMALEEALVEME